MPSDNDAKGVTFPSGKKEKEKKEKKHGRSIGWIIGVVVLILISVTFVLPTTVFSTNNGQKIVFGSYNGEEIAFIPSYDNYFYNQLSALAQSYGLTQQNVLLRGLVGYDGTLVHESQQILLGILEGG